MIGKFKVWDSKLKKWNETDYFAITRTGTLLKIIQLEVSEAQPHFIPVFSTGQTDKNGVELFFNDKVQFKYIDSDEWQECHIKENGVIEGDFGDFDLWTLGFAINSDYEFEKIGSKYEEK